MLVTLLCCIYLLLPTQLYASSGAHGGHIKSAPIDEKDILSRQRGARLFVNYCHGCHSLKYLRYERIAEDLRIPEDLVKDNLMFTGEKIGDQMRIAMSKEKADQWFGTAPPDLTLEARLKGVDWLYSYLIGFYPDSSRPWGVNNHVFKDVGMPHILEGLQVELGQEKFELAMADLTNFLAYAAEPTKAKREHIGVFVLLFLAILAVPVYFLNKEYWKDVK
ncbi:MAG: cytochrome c1 [Gammaproteobacteria bacterium]